MNNPTTHPRIIKWSTKSEDHASRVRNNQRRHRERVRNYITRLESELEESQIKLREAMVEIDRLKIELGGRLDSTFTDDSGAKQACDSASSFFGPSLEVPAKHGEEHAMSTECCAEDTLFSRDPGNCDILNRSTDDGGYGSWHEDECCMLEPPLAHESTTRCREAYLMIAEQNYAGVQASVIYGRLRPGFRGPLGVRDGCRVSNQLLFALIDHIRGEG